jgi:hypothetical protein
VAPPAEGGIGGEDTSSPPGDGTVWLANHDGGAVRSSYSSYQDGVISGGHGFCLR